MTTDNCCAINSFGPADPQMAKQKQNSGAVVDWYLISVDKLKYIGLFVVVVAIALGTYFYRDLITRSPKQLAQAAIADAEKALNDLAASKDFSAFRNEFDRGQRLLAEARDMMAAKDFPGAEQAAIEARSVIQGALATLPGANDSDAQFLSVEGNVEFQRAGAQWQTADGRAQLFNGDWVKTGSGASAELIFSNGSLYTVGPNALLEIYSRVNPATSRKQNSVKMEVGRVEINTADDTSTVSTPGNEVVVGSSSTTQVEVDESEKTEVVSISGQSTIRPFGGGKEVQLAAGTKLTSTKEGALSEVKTLLDPPDLFAPSDNQVIASTKGQTIELTWEKVNDAMAYRLQVSRSRLFGRLEIDAKRTQQTAKTKITSEGAYYWRVASISPDGETGPFSSYRRFRITGAGTSPGRAADMDTEPPSLGFTQILPLGGPNFMIEGKAEPGAAVFVNDQQVNVESDGSFRKLVSFSKVGYNDVVIKAIDPAGNQSIKRERVWVED